MFLWQYYSVYYVICVNIFLKNEVNELIKEISKEIPVIVVTHNSTIGASIKPDHLVYTTKVIENGQLLYKVFYGHPMSKMLKNSDGEEIQNIDILFNCLEAGEEAYYEKSGDKYNVHRVSDNKVLKNKYYSSANLKSILEK